MTVFPARRGFLPVPTALGRTPARPQDSPDAEAEPLTAARATPAEWARRRRVERETRRLEAIGGRVIDRITKLGPAWHVVDWPRTDAAAAHRGGEPAGTDSAGFLTIGPSGIFAITVVEHGRSRVLLAGDVVQINGRRPPYISETRRDARRAGQALSAAVGHPVPVFGVLTLVGSGVVSVHGLPREVAVTTHRELDHLLLAGGNRISPATADKLTEVARHPATWLSITYRGGADYRWFADGQTGADKRTARR